MSGYKASANVSNASSVMPEIFLGGLFVSATEIVWVSFLLVKEINQLMKDYLLNYILNLYQNFVKLF